MLQRKPTTCRAYHYSLLQAKRRIHALSTISILLSVAAASADAHIPVLQMNASQVHGMPPLPSAQKYDPLLPHGTPVQDAIWVSYLRREGQVQPLLPEHVTSTGGVQLLSGNASLQLGGWLRLDLHLGGVQGANDTGAVRVNASGLAILGSSPRPVVRLQYSQGVITHCSATDEHSTLQPDCGLVVHCANSTDCPHVHAVSSLLPSWSSPLGPGEALVTLHAALGQPSKLGGLLQRWSHYANFGHATQVSVGREHACTVRDDGSLWCWGKGAEGQLGTGSSSADSPQRVKPDEWGKEDGKIEVITVSSRRIHTCAVLADGSLWCWGNGDSGRLGLGSANSASTPQRVMANAWGNKQGQTAVESVSAHGAYTCAVLTDSSLWCWGVDAFGQLGLETSGEQYLPQRVQASKWGADHGHTAVLSVSAGFHHTCAVLADGSLWCWGDGANGRLGTGNSNNQNVPQQVQAPQWGQAAVLSVSTGWQHTCAVLADGSLWCWGDGANGRLGTGNSTEQNIPHRIEAPEWDQLDRGQTAVISVSAGYSHTCAVLADGSLWCWGDGANGRLGTGNNNEQNTPQQVQAPQWGQAAVLSVSAGYSHTCAVTPHYGGLSSSWCWGSDQDGRLGLASTGNQNVPQPLSVATSADSNVSHGCYARMHIAHFGPDVYSHHLALALLVGSAARRPLCTAPPAGTPPRAWMPHDDTEPLQYNWDWMAMAVTSAMDSRWPVSLHSLLAADDAISRSSAPVAALTSLRWCHVGTHDTAIVLPHVVSTGGPLMPMLSSSSTGGLPPGATSNCSGWQVAGVLHSSMATITGPQGQLALDASSAQFLMLTPPAELRLLAVGPVTGSHLPAKGGGIQMRLSHRLQSDALIKARLYNDLHAGHGAACVILWVQDFFVACSAPPGSGTVYVGVDVDGQQVDTRLPLKYNHNMSKAGVMCIGSGVL